jgi:hypothetical protein
MPSVEILVRASSSVSRAALVPLTGRGGMILMDLAWSVDLAYHLKKGMPQADLRVVSAGGQGHQAEVNQVLPVVPGGGLPGLLTKLLWRAWAMHEWASPNSEL